MTDPLSDPHVEELVRHALEIRCRQDRGAAARWFNTLPAAERDAVFAAVVSRLPLRQRVLVWLVDHGWWPA